MNSESVVIVGAGIAGVATAYWLCARHGYRQVKLVDRELPLSFTTSKSGENFRDCWPQPLMTAFSSRSIELMDELHRETDGAFEMRYTGYEFVSESDDSARFDWGVSESGDGSGLERITSKEILRTTRPYLSQDITQVVRIGRAGAIDVQALGACLLRSARTAGAEFVRAEVTTIEQSAGGYKLDLSGGESIEAGQLVLAAGPFTSGLAEMLGVNLDVENILQQKIVMPDPLGAVPRDMPFTIFADPQKLQWSNEEAELLASDPEFADLLEEFPAGVHIKPEGQNQARLGWAFNRETQAPRWEPMADDRFPEIVVRGASRFIPALGKYLQDMPGPIHHYAGYYTRTPENLPLIGPLGVDNAFIVSALSGYGTMAACAAAELLGAWMNGDSLPEYAAAFSPDRYEHPDVMEQVLRSGADGQL